MPRSATGIVFSGPFTPTHRRLPRHYRSSGCKLDPDAASPGRLSVPYNTTKPPSPLPPRSRQTSPASSCPRKPFRKRVSKSKINGNGTSVAGLGLERPSRALDARLRPEPRIFLLPAPMNSVIRVCLRKLFTLCVMFFSNLGLCVGCASRALVLEICLLLFDMPVGFPCWFSLLYL